MCVCLVISSADVQQMYIFGDGSTEHWLVETMFHQTRRSWVWTACMCVCVCVSVWEKLSLLRRVCEMRISCERPICPGVCPPVILPSQALQQTPKLSLTRTPRVQNATQYKQHWHCSRIWQPLCERERERERIFDFQILCAFLCPCFYFISIYLIYLQLSRIKHLWQYFTIMLYLLSSVNALANIISAFIHAKTIVNFSSWCIK